MPRNQSPSAVSRVVNSVVRRQTTYRDHNRTSRLIILPGGDTYRAFGLGDMIDKTVRALASAQRS